jgi:hypothetical protein
MDKMNWVQINSIQANRRMMKMYSPILCPNGSSFGSASDPAMK